LVIWIKTERKKDTNKERAQCLSSNANGNIGECDRKGRYKNGKICKFIPSLWGFKEKNICIPINCLERYNPHKMCKAKYSISSQIPDCNNNYDCSANGTLTYSLEESDAKYNYKKQFYVNNNTTTKDTSKDGVCKCICKTGYYGDTCNLKKKNVR